MTVSDAKGFPPPHEATAAPEIPPDPGSALRILRGGSGRLPKPSSTTRKKGPSSSPGVPQHLPGSLAGHPVQHQPGSTLERFLSEGWILPEANPEARKKSGAPAT